MEAWRTDLTVTPDMCDGESLWVVEANGQVFGFGQILSQDGSMVLDDLWIDPTHIGHGHGRELFNFLADLSARRGAARLLLEAEPSAVGFYERMGARVIGERPSNTIPGRVLPVMELALPISGVTNRCTE